MKHYYFKALKRYSDFEGRSRRAEYWTFALTNTVIGYLLYGMMALAFYSELKVLGLILSGLYMLFAIVMLIPGLAVCIRRLHDTGRSGWWVFICLIPIIGAIWFFVLLLLDGDKGENKYGPDPKAIDKELCCQ